jgi:hypothetical protein
MYRPMKNKGGVDESRNQILPDVSAVVDPRFMMATRLASM